jgi:recombination protein U|tara:strand:- start:5 stop:490 length:486 start_codon:yes stop_codon:yes gene_type:complete
MAKVDTGKNFENEIRKSLKKINCFWFRIQDTNDVSRFVKQAIAEKQPADFMAVYKGVPILLECKTSKRETSFPLYYSHTRAIPKHQVEAAQKIEKNGGKAFFLLRKDKPRAKRVFAVSYQTIQKFYRGKRKSVKWEQIEKEGIELTAFTNPVRWHLKPILL